MECIYPLKMNSNPSNRIKDEIQSELINGIKKRESEVIRQNLIGSPKPLTYSIGAEMEIVYLYPVERALRENSWDENRK